MSTNEFGLYIQARRRGVGLTQDDMAKALKKHVTYLSKIEGGKFTPPIRMLSPIAKALGVPIQELTTRIAKTIKGYEFTPSDFGLETLHGKVTAQEMKLIEAWRKLPAQVQSFIKRSMGVR